MSDYIKRSDAYNAIEKVMVSSDMPDDWYHGMTDAQYEICHVEPADVVSVIRCLYCKHSEESLVDGCVYCNEMDRAVSEKGYCHKGER